MKKKTTNSQKNLTTLAFAKDIARSALKLKAKDLKLLDLTKLSTFADYFVVASGTSDRHVEAIADSIIVEMKKQGRRPFGVEGYEHSQWIIVDFGDVVAHIFYGPMRDIYSIEKLWADAKALRVRETRIKRPAATKKKAKKK